MDALKALDIISGFIDGWASELEEEDLERLGDAEAFLYKYVREKEGK